MNKSGLAPLDRLIVELEQGTTPDGKMPERHPFFVWESPDQPNQNTFLFPSLDYLAPMDRLWELCMKENLARDFDEYREWLSAHRTERYAWIEVASLDEIDKFLFSVLRQEKFHDGLWASLVTNGVFLRVFRRYRVLKSGPG